MSVGEPSKNRNRLSYIIAIVLFLMGISIIAINWRQNVEENVTIVEAQSIITMQADQPRAKFIAHHNGIIIGLANSKADIETIVGDQSFFYDDRFKDKILMPGFIDPHVHPMQAAVMLNIDYIAPEDWNLPHIKYEGAQNRSSYLKKLKKLVASNKDKDLLITWGHHELFHGPIDRKQLDEISPELPLIIWQRSFHEIIMNSAALQKFDLESEEKFNALMLKFNVQEGHSDFTSGILSETALLPALGLLRPYLLSPEKLEQGFERMQQMMLENGVTTISDMATGIFADFDTEASLIKKAFGHDNAQSRVMLMPIAHSNQHNDEWLKDKNTLYSNDFIKLDKRVKLFADGAFFAQNMRMKPPGYDDGHIGKWMTEPDALGQLITAYWNDGWNLHIHVNGDEGLDIVLSHIKKLNRKNSQSITLEHLGYSTEEQNNSISDLKLMVSAQPNYIRVLGDVYSQHGLGEYRGSHINRLGSLERNNVTLGLHSDFNMAPIDPLYLAWIASNRITIKGNEKAPNERMSLDKALRGITIDAAQVIGMERTIGSLKKGKKADLAVLDQDPYIVGVKQLDIINVQGVIFEGRYIPSQNN